MLTPSKELKIRAPVRVARDQLAVDDAGAHRERLDGGDNHREAPRPIEPAPRDEPSALAVVMGDHAMPVMLDLVQPLWPSLAPHDRLPMQQNTLGSG
jgi:hypothetical protein